MTTHVICFSKTGNTRTVCTRLAEQLGVPLHEIHAPDIRPGIWGYLKLGYAALKGRQMRVEAPDLVWGPQDTLILGAPVWAGRVAIPMTSWLATQPARPPRTALVMTSGQTERPDSTFDRFAEAAGTPALTTLHVPEKTAKSGAFDAALDDFLGELETVS